VSLDIVRDEPQRRVELLARAATFRQSLAERGLPVSPEAAGQIIPIIIGEPAATMHWAAELRARGMFVPAIRPPTVAPGTSRLRITLSATHTDDQVDRLVAGLAELVPRNGRRFGSAA
jgi:8-amino-7-oxononanoate synthase